MLSIHPLSPLSERCCFRGLWNRAIQLRKKLEYSDGDHGHRNRGAHRQTDLQHEIKRRRTEHHAQQRANNERQRCQLWKNNIGWNIGAEGSQIRIVDLSICESYDVRILISANAFSRHSGVTSNRVYKQGERGVETSATLHGPPALRQAGLSGRNL